MDTTCLWNLDQWSLLYNTKPTNPLWYGLHLTSAIFLLQDISKEARLDIVFLPISRGLTSLVFVICYPRVKHNVNLSPFYILSRCPFWSECRHDISGIQAKYNSIISGWNQLSFLGRLHNVCWPWDRGVFGEEVVVCLQLMPAPTYLSLLIPGSPCNTRAPG